jgi:hypothetical protein
MHPETFSNHAGLHDYAERHGLDYVWEATAAFEKRRRTLSPEQFQIIAVHTRKGMTKALLFSKAISKAELLVLDTPWRRARRVARLRRIRKAG